jgi:oligopeptide transport system substrate-binding protein
MAKRSWLLPMLSLLLVFPLLLPACTGQASPAATATSPAGPTTPPPTSASTALPSATPTPTPSPTPKPQELKVGSLKVEPSTIFPGQEATVEAIVTNPNTTGGDFTVRLLANGVEADAAVVNLNPGISGKAKFPFVRDVAGKYELKIGDVSTTATLVDTNTFTNKTYNYQVSYPKDWTANTDKPALTTFISSAGGLTITCSTLPPDMSLETFVKYNDAQAAKDYAVFKQLGTVNITRKDGSQAVVEDYSFAQNSVDMRARVMMLKAGRWGYGVQLLFKPEKWPENEPLVQAILNSFNPPVVYAGTFTNTNLGFGLTLPTGWDATVTGPTPVMNILSPAGDPALVSSGVFLQHLGSPTTSKAYATADSANLVKSGGQIVSQGDITLGGGLAGYDILMNYPFQASTLRLRLTYAVSGSRAFMLLTQTLPATYDLKKTTIDQLVRSLTLSDPQPFGISRQDGLFLFAGEIVTLDPALAETSPEDFIGAVFSGLVKIDGNLKITGDLAEKWTVSPDAKTYTFTLRKDAVFHSGRPVSASDFKFSWERACDPKLASTKARTFLGDIAGAKEMLDGKAVSLSGVKVIDDRTLQVTLDSPVTYFLGKLCYITTYVVDRANVARGQNWYFTPNGTGPYKVKQWKKDELLLLERNDAFYGGPAKIKNVVVQLFTGRPMMMYEQGEIDITQVYSSDLDRVMDTANPLNKELKTAPVYDTSFFCFNNKMTPFDDPKVRQAFALAVNWDKIVEVSMKGNAERAAGILPKGFPGYNPDIKPLAYDPVKAKQLIAESKYGGVDKLPPISYSAYYAAGPAGEAILAMLKANLGVDIKVDAVKEQKEWQRRYHNRELQLFAFSWRADYLDPYSFLGDLFESSSQDNTWAYSNPAVDAALKAAATTQDEAERLKKYQAVEQLILSDYGVVPFSTAARDNNLVKPYVQDYRVYPFAISQWTSLSLRSR